MPASRRVRLSGVSVGVSFERTACAASHSCAHSLLHMVSLVAARCRIAVAKISSPLFTRAHVLIRAHIFTRSPRSCVVAARAGAERQFRGAARGLALGARGGQNGRNRRRRRGRLVGARFGFGETRDKKINTFIITRVHPHILPVLEDDAPDLAFLMARTDDADEAAGATDADAAT